MASIWFKEYKVADWEPLCRGTIHDSLGIVITDVGDDFISAKMPVDERTFQPMQLLHGGASVVLAESLGSMAGMMTVDPDKLACVGQSITAHHVRPGLKGFVHGKATPIRIGKTTQLWNIDIVDDSNKLVCTCRLQLAVIKKR